MANRCASAILAAVLWTTVSTGGARAEEPNKPFFAVDLLVAESVGLSSGPWDLYRGSGKQAVLVGSETSKKNGTYLGGGWGYRLIVGTARGVRASLEMGFSWGQLSGADLGWATVSGASHFDALASLGYQHTWGPVTLHTATVIGGDSTSVDVAGRSTPLPKGAIAATVGDDAANSLTRSGFRAGQQVGIHVAVAPWLMIYADGTLDYDGQWQVRAGVGFGGSGLASIRRRHSYDSSVAPNVQNVQINVAPQGTANIHLHSDGDAHLAVDGAPGSNVHVDVDAAGNVEVTPSGEVQIHDANGEAPPIDPFAPRQ